MLLGDLSDEPTAAAESVGGKLLNALLEPFVVAGTEVRTGASIGVSLYPDDAADTEALLRHADVAMYRAKAAGGGRIIFHQRSDTLASRRSSITAQLRTAIEAGEMEIHYQPVWQLSPTRDISGLEALLRWRHPDRGLLTPDAFMNLADQTTVGDDLMDWVLDECCRQAREWQAEDMAPMIGVNISPHQLLAPDFAVGLARRVADSELVPANFAIELTESAWTVDSAETLEVIADLRSAGFPMALDDFGAGYSSLSRLLDLGFDVIKIDGGMLVDVPGDADCGQAPGGRLRPRLGLRDRRRRRGRGDRGSARVPDRPRHLARAGLPARAAGARRRDHAAAAPAPCRRCAPAPRQAHRHRTRVGRPASLLRRMAVPKQKQSHARTTQRRSQHKVKAVTYNACPTCHSPRIPHRVCPVCGSYRGREVVAETRQQSA